MSAQWDIGWLIGTIILAVLAGTCWITFTVAGIRWRRENDNDRTWGIAGLITVVAGIFAVLLSGGFIWQSLPWSGQYHRFQPMGGTVTAIGSRFLASDTSGGGSTQKYVLTFANGAQGQGLGGASGPLSLGCLDTRCANVHVGDQVTLMCERVFQFNAPNEGWDCNWGRDNQMGQ
jgi:hypothetical protein